MLASEAKVKIVVRLADECLRAFGEDPERLTEVLGKIVELETAPEDFPAMSIAMLTWIDCLADHMLGGQRVRIQSLPGGTMVDEEGVTYVMGTAEADMNLAPEIIWASSVIDARLMMDKDRFEQLYAEVPIEAGEWGKYWAAVLNTCAATIREEPYGYALDPRRGALEIPGD